MLNESWKAKDACLFLVKNVCKMFRRVVLQYSLSVPKLLEVNAQQDSKENNLIWADILLHLSGGKFN